jgi:uncharacterized membrane protein YdjX (TVP38/TMEM64 family)
VSKAQWWRLGALVGVTVALLVVAKMTGLASYLEKERLRSMVLQAGPAGAILFVAAFCAGELVHVPGTVFVATAVVVYGRTVGGLLAYVGAIASFSLVFAVARSIGGTPLAQLKWPIARRILAQLDLHPVRTIVLLRLLLWMSPQLNYLLALSKVRFSRYLVGSAVGLALPVLVIVLVSDRWLN